MTLHLKASTIVAAVILALGGPSRAEPPQTVDFAAQIAPLLRERCLVCHGPDEQESGLRLDSAGGAMQGGYSGQVIVPSKSGESRLAQVIAGIAEDEVVMPPEGRRLEDSEIALIRNWIDSGAAWPDGLVLNSRDSESHTVARSTHWSFQPVVGPAPPDVRRVEWVANPIDRFILAGLEAEQIEPSPQADKPTLVRRLYLDLIGLPPKPEEVAAFVNDPADNAYDRLVDRLLDSPHYGERWARPWLDLAHYADSDGYLTDQLRPYAWRYRQWVVEALNRDLPFDQFSIEQLAGDLLPQATLDQRVATGFLRNTLSNREGGADLEEFRVEQIVDRAMTVGTTWLGLTVGCARCHDHKYDPISQREFFEFYAFFNSGDEVNVDAPATGEIATRLAMLAQYESRRRAILAPLATEIAELQSEWERKCLHAAANPGQDHIWDRQWEVLGLIWGGNYGEGQLEGTQIMLLHRDRRTQSQRDRLLDYFLNHGEIVDSKRFAELKLAALNAKLKELQARLPKLTRAQAMMETKSPRTTYLHRRGDFRAPGIDIAPGTLAVLPPLAGRGPKNRLALARWFFDPANPLTSRVTVNRSWQEFFGAGLVLTSENFGTQGEPPSHPELLDWLASEFVNLGWRQKELHRLIVTSATYRQSSHARPELAGRDPANRLFARQSALRLSAEQVRDIALSASGLLNPTVGGPCVKPPQPDSVSAEGFENKWEPSTGADRYRRGLYTWIQRLSPFAQNVTFDAPALSRACARRERSNTPLQALTLLNDPVFFEAAQALASRLIRESPGGFDERLTRAFEICLARPPLPDERERLLAYHQEQLSLLRDDPASAEAMFPTTIDGVDRADAAAWTGLASVMLNLHEFITRN